MPAIKPSEEYRMTVVPYRPFRKVLWAFALLFTFCLCIVGSFLIGRYYADGHEGASLVEYDKLKQELDEKIKESTRFQQLVANLKLAAEVDRKANEEVRAEIVALKADLAALEQDNTFYKSVMDPTGGDKGLVVDAPSVEKVGLGNAYKYKIVVKQIVAKNQKVSGYAEFILVGKLDGKEERLSIKDIDEKVTTDRIKLNFKYFQPIEGEMVLPGGFTPEIIELKVVALRPKKTVIEKKFGWLVKES